MNQSTHGKQGTASVQVQPREPRDEAAEAANTFPSWVAPLVTFLAVVVALFREEIRRWWQRPQLKLHVDLRPPDCHKTTMMRVTPQGQVLHTADCYYLRVWVQNTGGLRAEKVQVYMAALLKERADRKFSPVDSFLPMNLKWAHTGEVFADGISPRMGRHCDLAHVIDPAEAAKFDAQLPSVSADQTVVSFDLEVEPTSKSHMVGPGTYRITLQVGCANAKPITKHLELTLKGAWFADQAQMFKEGLGLAEVTGS